MYNRSCKSCLWYEDEDGVDLRDGGLLDGYDRWVLEELEASGSPDMTVLARENSHACNAS